MVFKTERLHKSTPTLSRGPSVKAPQVNDRDAKRFMVFA